MRLVRERHRYDARIPGRMGSQQQTLHCQTPALRRHKRRADTHLRCDILGWNVRRARASLGRFVDSGSRISGNHLLTAPELAAQHGSAATAVAI